LLPCHGSVLGDSQVPEWSSGKISRRVALNCGQPVWQKEDVEVDCREECKPFL
jgi:hypothetical protein